MYLFTHCDSFKMSNVVLIITIINWWNSSKDDIKPFAVVCLSAGSAPAFNRGNNEPFVEHVLQGQAPYVVPTCALTPAWDWYAQMGAWSTYGDWPVVRWLASALLPPTTLSTTSVKGWIDAKRQACSHCCLQSVITRRSGSGMSLSSTSVFQVSVV